MIQPAPGIIIAQEIKDTSTLVLDTKETRILKAKVISLGPPITTDFGTELDPQDYCKVGDNIYFLSYEGGYDLTVVDGKKYWMIKCQDLRGVIK